MAEKKKEVKVEIEREYNVPLRKEWLKVPRYKRAKKASKALKEFLIKHMKSDDVKIGKYANLEIWKHGIKNPPHHIKVIVKKDSEGRVTAEIPNPKLSNEDKKKAEAKIKEEKAKEKKTEKKESKKEEKTEKKKESKEVKTESKKEEPKKEKVEDKKTDTKKEVNNKEESKK